MKVLRWLLIGVFALMLLIGAFAAATTKKDEASWSAFDKTFEEQFAQVLELNEGETMEYWEKSYQKTVEEIVRNRK